MGTNPEGDGAEQARRRRTGQSCVRRLGQLLRRKRPGNLEEPWISHGFSHPSCWRRHRDVPATVPLPIV